MLFLLPPELRLFIYHCLFHEHVHLSHPTHPQPDNRHLRYLRVCKLLSAEAGPLFRSYISLRHEYQISSFLRHADSYDCAAITHADVANDGRARSRSQISMSRPAISSQFEQTKATPISNLYLALQKMPALHSLRVFNCRQGVPAPDLSGLKVSSSLRLAFEGAMFPDPALKVQLQAYQLLLDPTTRLSLFDKVIPTHIRTLRLSGDCQLPNYSDVPALRHLFVHAFTGTHFDRRPLHETFTGCQLESFVYSMGNKLGFEMRDSHLQSLATYIGSNLRKLVLLGCSRLTGPALFDLFVDMHQLQYLAIDLVTVNASNYDFIRVLSDTVSTFKLEVTNAAFAAPLIHEERSLCDAIEACLLWRQPPPDLLCLYFRDRILREDNRSHRWKMLAAEQKIRLQLGSWKNVEDIYNV
ncbi:hypothetical protein OF83DRAFT_1055117 [Amylostereum chailletii]|nr:hypothetical protein OF83DRAFT_1055117 [Amylostereum chailletii]